LRGKLQVSMMWKALWTTWTIDKPAAFGDWLWDVFVVQFAAFLDRMTVRRTIALVPVLILLLAYYHSIPVSPGLMLLGDLLAYADVFSMLLLLGILSRAATILFIVKQAAARLEKLAGGLITQVRRLDFRHRRASGTRRRTRSTGRSRTDDDGLVGGFAWA
jgi:hypothetical protein